jgi:hypothetical protein
MTMVLWLIVGIAALWCIGLLIALGGIVWEIIDSKRKRYIAI